MDHLAARIEDDEAGVRANAVGSRELPALSGSGVDGDEFDPVPVLGLQGRPHGAEAVSRSSRLDLDEVDLRGGDVACGAVRATVVRLRWGSLRWGGGNRFAPAAAERKQGERGSCSEGKRTHGSYYGTTETTRSRTPLSR